MNIPIDSEHPYQQLFECLPDPIGIVAGGRFVAVNRAMRDMTGSGDKIRWLGLHPADISPTLQPDGETSRSKAESLMNQARDGGALRFEWVHQRADGAPLFMEVTAGPCEWEGQPALSWSCRDISEHKKLEKNLRDGSELLAAFIQHSPIYAFIKEVSPTESRVLKASDNLVDMVGLPGAELEGKTMRELFPPEFAAKITADDWKIASDGQVLRFMEELNGRHYATVKFPIIQGERTLLAGYSIDITERMRVEQALRDSENHYQRNAGTVPVMLYDYVLLPDQSERFLYVGPACRDILGLDAREMEADPRRFWQLVHPDDRERFSKENQLAFQQARQSFATEIRIVTPAGASKWLQIASRPSSARFEGVPIWSGFFLDVTERKQFELLESSRAHILELLARAEPLPTLLEAIVRAVEETNPAMLCSILLLDPEGRRLLTGAAPSLPEFYNQAVHGLEIGPMVGSCGAAAWSGQRIIVEDVQTHANWIAFRELAAKAGLAACWSEPILSAAGKVLGTFAIYLHAPGCPQPADLRLIEQSANLAAIAIERSRNLEELERYRNLLEHQVRTDPLTGIANRRALDERADLEWRRALRHGGSIALLMIDIDRFKNYNDRYGHLAGDTCLRRVAQGIAASLTRADEFVARYGGEEFAVLLADSPLEQAIRTAERVRAKVLELAIPHRGAPADEVISVSIGVGALKPVMRDETGDQETAQYPPNSLEALFELADEGLYLAKSTGRNRVGVKACRNKPA